MRSRHFELFVSPLVWDEIALCDHEVSQRRCAFIDGLPVLAVDEQTSRIAEAFLASRAIPAKAATDASHIAVATLHGMDFLLTWNGTHIANAQTLRRLNAIAIALGYELPTICTPDELMEDPNE